MFPTSEKPKKSLKNTEFLDLSYSEVDFQQAKQLSQDKTKENNQNFATKDTINVCKSYIYNTEQQQKCKARDEEKD